MEYILSMFSNLRKSVSQHRMVFLMAFYISSVAIEYLATTPLQIKPIQNTWDKANHCLAFLVLYLTLSLGYPKLNTLKKFGLLLAFGVQIEIVQSFLPYREASFGDVLADGIGIILGMLIVKGITWNKK
jgi:VanZ family protein